MIDEERYHEEILLRLNVLISLLLDWSAPSSEITITSKVLRLSDLGLKPGQIAQIISKEANYVSAILSQQKKGKKSKERKSE